MKLKFIKQKRHLFNHLLILMFFTFSVSANSKSVPYSVSNEVNIVPLDSSISNYFGWSVSQSGNRILIGAPLDDLDMDGINIEGAAYIFEYSQGQWNQVAKLVASDANVPAAYAQFGGAVSLDGNKALVGANTSNGDGGFAGAAYVFELQSGQWLETARLSPSDAAANNAFGTSVSLSGNQAIIGAIGSFNDGFETGAAYVFKLDNGAWSETAKLIPSDGESRMFFGYDVSLEGNRALIGAHLDDAGGFYAGAAYVFESLDGIAWNESAKLTSNNPLETDQLGVSVSLSGDRILLGAYTNESGLASGSAYIFEINGNTWVQTAHIVPDGLHERNFFGNSVSLDNNRALIGAHWNQDNGPYSGAAFYYELNVTTGQWELKQKILASDGATREFFGRSVSLSGSRALIGASNDIYNGEAYVYFLGSFGYVSVSSNNVYGLFILFILIWLIIVVKSKFITAK